MPFTKFIAPCFFVFMLYFMAESLFFPGNLITYPEHTTTPSPTSTVVNIPTMIAVIPPTQTATSLPVSTPSTSNTATNTAILAPTSTDTPTPFPTPTVTDTPTSTFTPTPTPIPTTTPSPTPTATNRPTATPTSTPLSPLTTVELVSPLNGEGVGGKQIGLIWHWEGVLDDHEFFEVRAWHENDPPGSAIVLVKQKQFDYNVTPLREGKYYWSVIIIRDSNIRYKDWYRPGRFPYEVWEHDPEKEDNRIERSRESIHGSFKIEPSSGGCKRRDIFGDCTEYH